MNPNSNSGLQRNVLKNMETYATFGISKVKKKYFYILWISG